jgi:hypothetical protein
MPMVASLTGVCGCSGDTCSHSASDDPFLSSRLSVGDFMDMLRDNMRVYIPPQTNSGHDPRADYFQERLAIPGMPELLFSWMPHGDWRFRRANGLPDLEDMVYEHPVAEFAWFVYNFLVFAGGNRSQPPGQLMASDGRGQIRHTVPLLRSCASRAAELWIRPSVRNDVGERVGAGAWVVMSWLLDWSQKQQGGDVVQRLVDGGLLCALVESSALMPTVYKEACERAFAFLSFPFMMGIGQSALPLSREVLGDALLCLLDSLNALVQVSGSDAFEPEDFQSFAILLATPFTCKNNAPDRVSECAALWTAVLERGLPAYAAGRQTMLQDARCLDNPQQTSIPEFAKVPFPEARLRSFMSKVVEQQTFATSDDAQLNGGLVMVLVAQFLAET